MIIALTARTKCVIILFLVYSSSSAAWGTMPIKLKKSSGLYPRRL